MGADLSQHPQPEQARGSHLHRSKTEPVSFTRAGPRNDLYRIWYKGATTEGAETSIDQVTISNSPGSRPEQATSGGAHPREWPQLEYPQATNICWSTPGGHIGLQREHQALWAAFRNTKWIPWLLELWT